MPTVELRPALEQLIDYPYGCVEQTTSKLYAMLHVPELLAAESPGGSAARAVDSMIDAGIARLWSMQTRSGGLGYWPGATQSDWWGTAYAAGFLLEARRAGHAVDDRFLAELAAYLESLLRDRTETSFDANARAQVCRVLAGLNRPQLGWMARLAERLDQLDAAGRAHLAAAWLEMGQKNRALAALPDDTIGLVTQSGPTGRLTSQVHQDGVLLSALLDIDKDHPWIPALIGRLEAVRKNGHWTNTFEVATALAALARYQTTSTTAVEFEGTVHTHDGHKFTFSHSSPAVFKIAPADGPIRITSRGTGQIYVAVTTEGLLKNGSFTAYDRQLKVRRRWTTADGKESDPTSVRVGDLVQVELTVEAPAVKSSESLANIAIVDALPGGMEVENPRLATSARSVEIGDTPADQPDRVEFQDDRVVLFTSVSAKPRVFRYGLRAITSGTFRVPPIQASSMYDPAFASIHGGRQVEIHK